MGQAVRIMSDSSVQEPHDTESIDKDMTGDSLGESESDSNGLINSLPAQPLDNDYLDKNQDVSGSTTNAVNIRSKDDSAVSAAYTISGRGINTGVVPKRPWAGYGLKLTRPRKTDCIDSSCPVQSPERKSELLKPDSVSDSDHWQAGRSLLVPGPTLDPMTSVSPGRSNDVENLASLMENHTLTDNEPAADTQPHHIPPMQNCNLHVSKETSTKKSTAEQTNTKASSNFKYPTLFTSPTMDIKFAFKAGVSSSAYHPLSVGSFQTVMPVRYPGSAPSIIAHHNLKDTAPQREHRFSQVSSFDGSVSDIVDAKNAKDDANNTKNDAQPSPNAHFTASSVLKNRKILPLPTPRRKRLVRTKEQQDPKLEQTTHSDARPDLNCSLQTNSVKPTLTAPSKTSKLPTTEVRRPFLPLSQLAKNPSNVLHPSFPQQKQPGAPTFTSTKGTSQGCNMQMGTEPNSDPNSRECAKKMKRSETTGEERKILTRPRERKWKAATDEKSSAKPGSCHRPGGIFDFSVKSILKQARRLPVAPDNSNVTESHAKSTAKSPLSNRIPGTRRPPSVHRKKKGKLGSLTEESELGRPVLSTSIPPSTPKNGKKMQRKKKDEDRGLIRGDKYGSGLALFQSTNPEEWICMFCQFKIFCSGVEEARRTGGFYRRQRERQRRLREAETRRNEELGSPVSSDSEGE